MNAYTAEPTTTDVEISHSDALQIVQDVFGAMLQLEIEASHCESSEPRLNACIQITGAWLGAIVIELTPQFAQRAASIVFDLPIEQVTVADVNDALAELVNMIGGNLKTLLPSPSMLSLPTVTAGQDFLLSLPGAKLLQRIPFTCDSASVELLIFVKQLPLAPSSR